MSRSYSVTTRRGLWRLVMAAARLGSIQPANECPHRKILSSALAVDQADRFRIDLLRSPTHLALAFLFSSLPTHGSIREQKRA